jgi:hypothetical protein
MKIILLCSFACLFLQVAHTQTSEHIITETILKDSVIRTQYSLTGENAGDWITYPCEISSDSCELILFGFTENPIPRDNVDRRKNQKNIGQVLGKVLLKKVNGKWIQHLKGVDRLNKKDYKIDCELLDVGIFSIKIKKTTQPGEFAFLEVRSPNKSAGQDQN